MKMALKAGDQVIIEAKKVHGSERAGTVERVLAESPPRYLVRWDNGRQSIISPAAGELHLVVKAKAAARGTANAAKQPAKRRRPPKSG
jgi:Domain of unknown function (DUF1918)